MNRRTLLFLLVVLALVAAYFGITSYIRAHVDELIHAAVGKNLPAFSLADGTGRTWTAADLQGKRAILHFFRSRCGACEAEAPAIRALEAKLPADVVLLHVMTDAVLEFEPELTAQTLAGKQFTRPVLMADAAFVNAFHKLKWSSITPISYVVDTGGVVRFGLRGAQTEAAIEAALAAAQ